MTLFKEIIPLWLFPWTLWLTNTHLPHKHCGFHFKDVHRLIHLFLLSFISEFYKYVNWYFWSKTSTDSWELLPWGITLDLHKKKTESWEPKQTHIPHISLFLALEDDQLRYLKHRFVHLKHMWRWVGPGRTGPWVWRVTSCRRWSSFRHRMRSWTRKDSRDNFSWTTRK